MLIEKINNEESRFSTFSLLAAKIYNTVDSVKCKIVTQPDIDAMFEYNYCIQIKETGLNSLKLDLSIDTTFDPPRFWLVNTYKI